MPQGNQVKMVISQPTTFDQSEEICQYLKEFVYTLRHHYSNSLSFFLTHLPLYISFHNLKSLNGHIQKISNSIFLIAPAHYDIDNEMGREEVKSKLSTSSHLIKPPNFSFVISYT